MENMLRLYKNKKKKTTTFVSTVCMCYTLEIYRRRSKYTYIFRLEWKFIKKKFFTQIIPHHACTKVRCFITLLNQP